MIEHGADVNTKHIFGDTALIIASEFGHLDRVKCLVENGADVNQMTQYNETALMKASEEGHLEIVKYLNANDDKKKQS